MKSISVILSVVSLINAILSIIIDLKTRKIQKKYYINLPYKYMKKYNKNNDIIRTKIVKAALDNLEEPEIHISYNGRINNKKIHKRKYKRSLVEQINEKIGDESRMLVLIFSFYTLMYCTICKYFNIVINNIVLIILCITIVLVWLFQFIFEFRIKKGYYGTNYDEAKQIVAFIKKNNDDFDKGKKIFLEEKSVKEIRIYNGVTENL